VLSAEPPPEASILESHGVPPHALGLLRAGNEVDFLSQRLGHLLEVTRSFLQTRARWDEPDRPSLQSLIIEDEED
jgi:hypothetical protein